MEPQKRNTKPRGYADGIPVYCAHDEIVPIGQLRPNPKNPNKHPHEQIEKLGKIIRGNGWRNPITVSTRSGLIVKGHGRLMTAQLEELKEVPVEYQNYESEEAELADLTADNRIAELAETDRQMLADIFADIDTGAIDFELSGYTEDEYGELASALSEAVHNELNDPDEVPEVPEEADIITQRGDIWILGGRHRVMCGDSTDADQIEMATDGKKVDLVFTDPPYGMGKESDGIAGDNIYKDELLDFNKKWIPLSFDALKDVGSWYCWGIDLPLFDIYEHILKPMIQRHEITWRNYIVWNKGVGQGQNSENHRQYATATEKCLFVMKGRQTTQMMSTTEDFFEGYEPIRAELEAEAKKAKLTNKIIKEATGCGSMYSHWFTRSQWSLMTRENYEKLQAYAQEKGCDAFKKDYDAIKKDYDAIKKDYDAQLKEWYKTRAYFNNTHDNMTDVWSYAPLTAGSKERAETGGHASPKPVAMCERAIKTSCPTDGIVLDLFGGSGSTLIACESLLRRCVIIELTPMFVDVIVKRYIRATGSKDVKCIRNGEQLSRDEIAGIFA